MIKINDRVGETTTSTGTGTINLAGAKDSFITFVAGIGNGHTCYYLIAGTTEWEVGIGTVTDAATDTLSRTTVLGSSNAGALVNFSAGAKDVFCVAPAELLNRPLGSLIASSKMYVEADVGIGVADGASVTTWANQQGTADWSSPTEATNKPTYRAADSIDGLPYVEFDGTNDVLETIRGAPTLYTGTDLTFYIVVRYGVSGTSNGLFCFSENGENMSTGFRPFIQVGAGGKALIGFNGTTYSFTGNLSETTGWQVVAFRTQQRFGRWIATYYIGGHIATEDIAAGAPTAEDFERIRFGAQYNNFGAVGNYLKCDFRGAYLYESAHSDIQMAQMIKYLRNKWKADPLFA